MHERRAANDEPRLLMCRPTHYTIAYEINPWMSLKRQVNYKRAQRQWNNLYRVLSHDLKLSVQLLRAKKDLPDLVFTANAGIVSGRTFIRSNFRHAERRGEEPVIERYAKQAGFKLLRLPKRYTFEGEGDALWMGKTLVFGFRFRSEARTHEQLSSILGARVLPLELTEARFYHLDTCFAPLDTKTALWFPGAFDRYGRKVIERLVNDPIAVSESDAKRFVCNAIVVPAPIGPRTSIKITPGRSGSRRTLPAPSQGLRLRDPWRVSIQPCAEAVSPDTLRERNKSRAQKTIEAQDRYIVLQEGFSAALSKKLAKRGFRICPVDLSEFMKAGGSAKCLVLWLPP